MLFDTRKALLRGTIEREREHDNVPLQVNNVGMRSMRELFFWLSGLRWDNFVRRKSQNAEELHGKFTISSIEFPVIFFQWG